MSGSGQSVKDKAGKALGSRIENLDSYSVGDVEP